MSESLDFPLFPLEVVVLPTELLPLHIFEERYKVMIEECLDNETEFGIVYSDGDDRDVGCAVEIADVLERMDDGRMNIVCRGTRPFLVLDWTDAFDYPAGEVEFLADEPEERDQPTATEAHQLFGELVVRATDEPAAQDDLQALTSYSMAARVDFGAEAKLGLLSLRSENARLRLLAKLLRAVTKRIDVSAEIQERARMNGKVRFD
jgi:Lon protease-like protein